MLSIDQNSHSLWDTLPKLHALAGKGVRASHFIEDVDAAFTAMGAEVGSGSLSLTRERYHRSGGADWGAALFYTEFLGRQPMEIRDFEPFTGMKTSVLAKKLSRSVDDLYDEFSPSDNWQLIGPSFVGDREHHRIVGDLTLTETAPFVRDLLAKARENVMATFPADACRDRAADWFDRELAMVERLLHELSGGQFVDLYRRWMGERLGETASLGLTSELFSSRASNPPGLRLMGPFLGDYTAAARLYNDAIAESGMALRPLDTKAGELPLFAVFEHEGHLVRTGMFLRDGAVNVPGLDAIGLGADGGLSPAILAGAGIRCVVGKAVLLVAQVRSGETGRELALPHRGSAYMPAAHEFVRRLDAAGRLGSPLRPIVRVRLRLLDHMAAVDTPIVLPAHLAEAFGQAEVSSRKFAESWRDIARAAA